MRYAKLIGVILGIILFGALISGITYATIAWRSKNINIIGTTESVLNAGNIDVKQLVNQDNMALYDSKSIINSNNVTIKNNMTLSVITADLSNFNGQVDISIDISELSDCYIKEANVAPLRYIIASFDPNIIPNATIENLTGKSLPVVKTGIINKKEKTTLFTTEVLSNTKIGYVVIFYNDMELSGNEIAGAEFSGNIIGNIIKSN